MSTVAARRHHSVKSALNMALQTWHPAWDQQMQSQKSFGRRAQTQRVAVNELPANVKVVPAVEEVPAQAVEIVRAAAMMPKPAYEIGVEGDRALEEWKD